MVAGGQLDVAADILIGKGARLERLRRRATPRHGRLARVSPQPVGGAANRRVPAEAEHDPTRGKRLLQRTEELWLPVERVAWKQQADGRRSVGVGRPLAWACGLLPQL